MPSPEMGFEETIFDCLRVGRAPAGASHGAITEDRAEAEATGVDPAVGIGSLKPGMPEERRPLVNAVGVVGPAYPAPVIGFVDGRCAIEQILK